MEFGSADLALPKGGNEEGRPLLLLLLACDEMFALSAEDGLNPEELVLFNNLGADEVEDCFV